MKETSMNDRVLAYAGALTIAFTFASLVPLSAAGQDPAGSVRAKPATAANAWTPPRTPDGQPDLQGVWLNTSATPLERPKASEVRAVIPFEEFVERKITP